MRSIDEMIDGYERLVGQESGLFESFCWTVIRPAPSEDELEARIGTDVSRVPPVGLTEFWEAYPPDGDADSAAWVIGLDTATALLEVNGFAGSMPANLVAWTSGSAARVVSFYWNSTLSKSMLSAAVGGGVEQYDLLDDYEDLSDLPVLRDAIEQVRSRRRRRSDVAVEGLALVEVLTEVEFERGILSRSWPAMMFVSHVEDRPVRPAQIEQMELAGAWAAASRDHQVEALVVLVEAVTRATGLADEPAVQRLGDRIRRSEVVVPGGRDELDDVSFMVSREPRPYIRKGKVDLHHMGFRRLQASAVLRDMLRADLDLRMIAEDGPFYHARYALDELWPSTRAELLRVLATQDRAG